MSTHKVAERCQRSIMCLKVLGEEDLSRFLVWSNTRRKCAKERKNSREVGDTSLEYRCVIIPAWKTTFNDSTQVSLCQMKEVSIVSKQWIRMATVAVVAILASGLFLVHANSAHAGSGHAPIVIQSDSDFTSCVC